MSRERSILGIRCVIVGLLMMIAGSLLAASYVGFCFVGCVLIHPYLPYGIAVGAAGFAVLVLGLYFLATPEPSEAAPRAVLSLKVCPLCGSTFPLDHNVCPRDGSLLRAEP